MKKNNYYIIILLVVIPFFMASCQVERDIAREFVQQDNDISVLLLTDTTLYKLNDKVKDIPNFDSLSVDVQDSLWMANTLYLDSVDDKKVINTLYSRIKSELEYFEFHVYTMKNKKDFDALNSEAYIFKISQVELEEDKYTYTNEYSFPHDTTVYFKNHDLNKIDLNCWFDLIPKDSSTDHKKVFYNSFSIEDKLDGSFYKDQSNSVKYKYRIIPIQLNDIYYLTAYSGNKHANYLFNYFMNKYIRAEMPPGFSAEGYYSLDPDTGYINYDEDENDDNSFYEIQ